MRYASGVRGMLLVPAQPLLPIAAPGPKAINKILAGDELKKVAA